MQPNRQVDDPGYVCELDALPKVYESDHFFINYDRLGRGLTIEDYADALEAAYRVQVEEYGWAAPPLCTKGERECEEVNPWRKYPVQIYDLTNEEEHWDGFVNAVGDYTGVVGDNPNTSAREISAAATCMGLNSYLERPESGTRLEAVNTTAQHEFQHMIQFGYVGYGEDKDGELIVSNMWYESMATFFEDETYDDVNYPTALLWPDHTACLADYDRTGDPYANWLFFQFVAEQNGGSNRADGGENVLQGFWEGAVRTDNALTTFDAVLDRHDTTLDDTFHAYATSLAFSKGCAGTPPGSFCFEEGADYLAAMGEPPERDGSIRRASGEYRGTIREGYAMNFVDLPAGRVFTATLDNTARGGTVRGSLVCERGDGLEVTPFPSDVPSGNDSSIERFDGSSCEQLTAVLTSHTNNDACTARAYRLRLSAPSAAAETAATPTVRPRATRAPAESAAAPTRIPSTRPTRAAQESEERSGSTAPTPLSCLPALAGLLALALWRRPAG